MGLVNLSNLDDGMKCFAHERVVIPLELMLVSGHWGTDNMDDCAFFGFAFVRKEYSEMLSLRRSSSESHKIQWT